MSLPSFQSAFVPGNVVFYPDVASNGQGEPDSDFEYDIYSDCSSNLSSIVSIGLDEPSPPQVHLSEDEGLDVSSSPPLPPPPQKKKKIHPCASCTKTFQTRAHLEEHIRYRHSDVREYQCNQCSKVFKSKSNLNQHVRTHEASSFLCGLCGKTFTAASGYRYHMLTHEPVKRFACEICPKTFLQNKLLQKHIRSCHSDERNYPCLHCPAAFKRKDHLNRHVTDTHSLVANLFECTVDSTCRRRFQSVRALKQHEKLHEETLCQFKCSMCDKTFARQRYLKGHEKRHKTQDLLLAEFGDSVNDVALNAFIQDIVMKSNPFQIFQ